MEKDNKKEALQWYAQNRGLYKKLSEKVHTIIGELLEESNIAIHAIDCRAKEVDSLKNKIEDPKYDDPLNQITDFAGIRIIAYVENDLKPICEIIKSSFDIDTKNSRDKSEELGTDKVGYKSIHYIAKIKSDRLQLPEYRKFKELKFEIQVRTILQHAWAEIEHDRNYKFNGVLPPEIQRRFKILAGSLELIDREFNLLSLEIDQISEGVNIADEQKALDEIIINSTTLKQFLNNRFKKLIVKGSLEANFSNQDDRVIKELHTFGIDNLNQLDKSIPKDYAENFEKIFTKEPSNFLGLLRLLLVINNYEKYFLNCWDNSWNSIDPDVEDLLSLYNIDCENLKTEYNLVVG